MIPLEKIISQWSCDNCGELHDEEDDALECCPPAITKVFFCPVCDESHLSEQQARECCPVDPEAPPPLPSARELEAAGQMRLFL